MEIKMENVTWKDENGREWIDNNATLTAALASLTAELADENRPNNAAAKAAALKILECL